MQLHAAEANAEGEAANGATVNASQARGGPDADAFTERGNDFNLRYSGPTQTAFDFSDDDEGKGL